MARSMNPNMSRGPYTHKNSPTTPIMTNTHVNSALGPGSFVGVPSNSIVASGLARR